jgi:hypothetical protein
MFFLRCGGLEENCKILSNCILVKKCKQGTCRVGWGGGGRGGREGRGEEGGWAICNRVAICNRMAIFIIFNFMFIDINFFLNFHG